MSASRRYGPRERGRHAGDRYVGEALVRIASMDGVPPSIPMHQAGGRYRADPRTLTTRK